ncbi:MAG: hypothetical protein KDB90_06510 [Planctomycetes bacterium]|nr:hypothetical protein [Planctomycetota bacterium]
MHPYLYIVLPMLGAVIVLLASGWLIPRRRRQHKPSALQTLVPLGLAWSFFFAAQFALFAFIPGQGSGGPVQYIGDDSSAMALFHYRFYLLLFTVLFLLPLMAMDLGLVVAAVIRKNWRFFAGSMVACCLSALGLFLALSYTYWLPTV